LTAYRVLRAVLGPVVRWFWRVEAVGVDLIPPGACVLAPNHDSLSDPFFVGAAVPRPLRFLTKAELFRFPLAPIIRSLGAIPVRRGESDRGAIASAVAAVQAGDTVVIHPQGTVLGAPDRPWRRGAARVAIEAGVPLVPVCLIDTDQVLRPRTKRIRRARVALLVGEPIAVEAGEPDADAAAALTEEVRAAVEALHRSYRAAAR
jgi:1-acyl-sn-glycerol-3-phosphate acyltransferase